MSDSVDDKVSEGEVPSEESVIVPSTAVPEGREDAAPAVADSSTTKEGAEEKEEVSHTEGGVLSPAGQEGEAEKQTPAKEEALLSPADKVPTKGMDEASPSEQAHMDSKKEAVSSPIGKDPAEGVVEESPAATEGEADSSPPDQAPTATDEANKEGEVIPSPPEGAPTEEKVDSSTPERTDTESKVTSSPQEQVSKEVEVESSPVPAEGEPKSSSPGQVPVEGKVQFSPIEEAIPPEDAPVDEGVVSSPAGHLPGEGFEPSPEQGQPIEFDQADDLLPASHEIESPVHPTASAVATASPNDACRDTKDQCFHHPLVR